MPSIDLGSGRLPRPTLPRPQLPVVTPPATMTPQTPAVDSSLYTSQPLLHHHFHFNGWQHPSVGYGNFLPPGITYTGSTGQPVLPTGTTSPSNPIPAINRRALIRHSTHNVGNYFGEGQNVETQFGTRLAHHPAFFTTHNISGQQYYTFATGADDPQGWPWDILSRNLVTLLDSIGVEGHPRPAASHGRLLWSAINDNIVNVAYALRQQNP